MTWWYEMMCCEITTTNDQLGCYFCACIFQRDMYWPRESWPAEEDPPVPTSGNISCACPVETEPQQRVWEALLPGRTCAWAPPAELSRADLHNGHYCRTMAEMAARLWNPVHAKTNVKVVPPVSKGSRPRIGELSTWLPAFPHSNEGAKSPEISIVIWPMQFTPYFCHLCNFCNVSIANYRIMSKLKGNRINIAYCHWQHRYANGDKSSKLAGKTRVTRHSWCVQHNT